MVNRAKWVAVMMATMGFFSVANASTITDAIDWLVANQDPSGLWGENKQSPFRDATVAIEALYDGGASATAINEGRSAVEPFATTTTDFLARQIIVLSTETSLLHYLLDSLRGLQNTDGGWGYRNGYGSSPLESSLALKALWLGRDTASLSVVAAIDSLVSAQNVDGGWSVLSSAASNVYVTAQALLSLSLVQSTYDVSTAIANGVNWLESQPNPDGGFGTGGASNPYETGYALAAIAEVDTGSTVALDARSYLESSQLPNGSWNDDAYSTAVALLGIIRHSTLQSRHVALARGVNLVGLPLATPEQVTTTTLLGQIPNATTITGWNSSGQSWETAPFTINADYGFLVEVSSASQMGILGYVAADTQCINLQAGLNLISLPSEGLCYSGSALRADIPNCVEVHEWHPALQRWQSVVQPSQGSAIGVDFSINPGMSIFIRSSSGGQWCTQECSSLSPAVMSSEGGIAVQPPDGWPNHDLQTQNSPANTFSAAAVVNSGTALATSLRIRDVHAGNRTSASATITWVTDSASVGCVHYGLESTSELARCQSSTASQLHLIDIDNLIPDTTYVFEVISDGVTDDNGGSFYSIRTADIGSGIPSILYGRVLREDSIPPAVAIVKGTVSRVDGPTSMTFVSFTDTLGFWVANLGNLKHATTGEVYPYMAGDSVHLDVDAGFEGVAESTYIWSGSTPANAGDILLNPCACDCHADPGCDLVTNIFDVIQVIDVAFRGETALPDHSWICPYETTDVNCSGATDIIDVSRVVNVAFRNGDPAAEYCEPCP